MIGLGCHQYGGGVFELGEYRSTSRHESTAHEASADTTAIFELVLERPRAGLASRLAWDLRRPVGNHETGASH